MTPRQVSVTLAGKDVEVTTAAGVFSSTGLDRGTAVLLTHTRPVKSGNVLDLGCGWGAIALDTGLASPAATVWALDVNERALQLTAANAKALNLQNIRAVTADKIPTDMLFTQIRSNPPIRVGKKVLHELMRTWIPRLAPCGTAELVVAKALGASSFAAWLEGTFAGTHTVSRIARDSGFHVLEVRAAAA